ncbi:MAG: twin-arginine translocase TatA/TatE family subunit [bacterium]
MPNIGPLEIAIVLIIVLIIFGPKRLPELGRSMGRGIREFRSSVTGKNREESPGSPESRELAGTSGSGDPAPDDEPVQGEVVSDKKS